MRIGFQAALLAANHQRHFGVHLVAKHAINHVRARVFQLGCPRNIVRFVKPRHQFHHHGYLLARQRRRHQSARQLRMAARAVNRHFNRHHIGVVRRIADKFHNRLKRLIRMMQQNITLGDFVQQRSGFAQGAWILRRKRRKLQIGAVHHVRHRNQPHQIHRAFHLIQLIARELKLFQQKLANIIRTLVGNFQPHTVAKIAVAQFVLNRRAQVAQIVVFHRQIAVARQPELVAAFHRHAAKQLVHIFMHNGRQKHKAIFAIANAFRQPNCAGQNARGLHDCHARSASKRILSIQFHHKIQRLIQRARKRMRCVQANRRENRQQLAVEIIFNPFALLIVPLLAAVKHDIFFGKRRQQFLVKYLILLFNNLVRFLRHQRNGFAGRLP